MVPERPPFETASEVKSVFIEHNQHREGLIPRMGYNPACPVTGCTVPRVHMPAGIR